MCWYRWCKRVKKKYIVCCLYFKEVIFQRFQKFSSKPKRTLRSKHHSEWLSKSTNSTHYFHICSAFWKYGLCTFYMDQKCVNTVQYGSRIYHFYLSEKKMNCQWKYIYFNNKGNFSGANSVLFNFYIRLPIQKI